MGIQDQPDYKRLYEQEKAHNRLLKAELALNAQTFIDVRKKLLAFEHQLRARYGCVLCYRFGHRAENCPSN